jgi:hypothetical protein
MRGTFDINFDDVQEPYAVKPNEEYKLRIVDICIDYDKNGNPYLLPRFEIVDEPYAKEFTKFFRLPCTDMTPKELNNCKFALKRFFEAFEIPTSGGTIDTDDIIGLEGWAILGIEEDDCPFPIECNKFPCNDLCCNADVCNNGYAYRMS